MNAPVKRKSMSALLWWTLLALLSWPPLLAGAAATIGMSVVTCVRGAIR